MPLTTILFDLDDTLFDHAGTARAALAASTAPFAFEPPVTLDELYRRYSEQLEAMHLRVMAGEIDHLTARRLRFQQLLAPYGVLPDEAAAEAFAALHYGHYRRLRQPIAGAVELLTALKPGYRIGIVTNNRTEEQVDKLQALGMTHLVDALITSEDVGVLKPDPRIFRVALARLGARPADAVLIGDNWTADVLGAQAAGIRPVWLNRFGLPCPDARVATLTSLEPLPAVLRVIDPARVG